MPMAPIAYYPHKRERHKNNGPQSAAALETLLKEEDRWEKEQRVLGVSGFLSYHQRKLTSKPLIVAAWSVRTPLAGKKVNRPNRRTALAARELQ